MPSLQKILNIFIYSYVAVSYLALISVFFIIFGAITYKNENIIKNKKASIIILTIGCTIFLGLLITPMLLRFFV